VYEGGGGGRGCKLSAMYVCVYVCVCVYDKEWWREKLLVRVCVGGGEGRGLSYRCVCVCVCVCNKEWWREKLSVCGRERGDGCKLSVCVCVCNKQWWRKKMIGVWD